MKKSFTLIELLVTISIVLILITVGVPIVTGPVKKEAQSQQINKAIIFIQRAQSYARNPENKDATSYSVARSGDELAIFRQVTGPTDTILEDEKLTGYKINTFTGKVQFKCFDGQYMSATPSTSATQPTIVLQTGSLKIEITFDASGQPTGRVI
jgi:prepilin-type N-terminal cleavage/methylation domain-containing protein